MHPCVPGDVSGETGRAQVSTVAIADKKVGMSFVPGIPKVRTFVLLVPAGQEHSRNNLI